MGFVLGMLLAVPLTMHVDGLYHDRIELDAHGQPRVVRTSEHDDLAGGKRQVEQRIRPLGEGNYAIDFREQSEETLAYHRALCAQHGMEPQFEGQTQFKGAGGWICGKSEILGD